MAVTATPVFPQAPFVSAVRVTAANTSSQGGGTIGTDIFLAGQAGANGAYVERVRFSPTATAPTTTTGTVGRVFWSTVSSGSTSNANTFLLGEIQLPATSADNASSPAVNPAEIPPAWPSCGYTRLHIQAAPHRLEFSCS